MIVYGSLEGEEEFWISGILIYLFFPVIFELVNYLIFLIGGKSNYCISGLHYDRYKH